MSDKCRGLTPAPDKTPSSDLRPKSDKPRILFITVIAILGVITLCVWNLVTDFEAPRQESDRMQMLSISMALMNYNNLRGHLPCPAVTRNPSDVLVEDLPVHRENDSIYSWRVEIIPYLEGWHGSWDPSQPWDSPANKQLVYLSRFYAFGVADSKDLNELFPETNILAITGPGTAFGDGNEPPMTLKDVPSATILAAEIRSSGIPWPKPGDFDIRTMPRTVNALNGKGISGRNNANFHVIFADGQVWLLSGKVKFETLIKFFTTADAGKQDREEVLGPFALCRGP